LKYVAEIGINHLGSTALAQKYCNFLVHSEIDGISFQIREVAQMKLVVLSLLLLKMTSAILHVLTLTLMELSRKEFYNV
jgi:hypothetical protein